MRRKTDDRHVGPPSEANRDKHINFIALEKKDPDPSNDFEDERSAPRKIKKHHPVALKRQSYKRDR